MLLKNEINWFLIRKKLDEIKLIIFDVDGVLTNGKLIYDEKGFISKGFDVRDGLGIKLLQDFGIDVAIVSGGSRRSTEARAKDLNIKYCYTEVKDKSKIIKDLTNSLGFLKSQVIFLGDDLNDLVVKKNVALLITTKDGSTILKKQSDAVLKLTGGNGAVRELAERILKRKRGWSDIKRYGWKDIN
tara:strand:+ start:1101 stop:1658 length:558 start_codon:yes stop_codon:yes gene_type:complete